ncbi:MAG: type I-E CRISPR-associated protein Cas5/CasD [Anaerolineales bacterium]
MTTLLFRLVAPLQSWGVQSHFTIRDTANEPSKSGVAGVLCAALGVDREDDAALRRVAAAYMGVRADREGMLKRDYHSSQNILKAQGGTKETDVSLRWYLADAAFLVGLHSDDRALLEELYAALQAPLWPLFLGRKACVPGEPLFFKDRALALQEKPLVEALNTFPRLRPKRHRDDPDWMRGLVEHPGGEIARQDQPLSFRKGARQFAVRRIRFERLGAGESLPLLNEFAQDL